MLGQLALSGRVWWWAMVDLAMTPVVVVAVPLLVGAVAAYLRRMAAIGLAVLQLAVAQFGGQADLGALAACADAPAHTLRVTSWNTLYWHVDSDRDAFYALLREQRADVLVLQEYMGHDAWVPRPIDDLPRLRAEFPGTHIAAAGELLTVSRFPIVDQRVLTAEPAEPATGWREYWTHRVLRTDLDIAGRVLSVYNVHLADPIDIAVSPLSVEFLTSAEYLGRWKAAQLDLLRAELAANPNPVLLTGDVNFPPGSGEERALEPLSDAACGAFLPTTFAFRGLWWWRLDRTFTSEDVRVHEHAVLDPRGQSTHKLQNLVVSIKE
ncbi:endonuclease/exonuclease/phosphatase family protein [Actinokineospora fastidiosa]|nr:endonuclease/exonuclease/phosphatase family protein [Actinokineospora fastidiosa]